MTSALFIALILVLLAVIFAVLIGLTMWAVMELFSEPGSSSGKNRENQKVPEGPENLFKCESDPESTHGWTEKGKSMRGKVKWFSKEKGYGFITGEDGEDRYFDVRSVKGSELPDYGDIVEFEHQEGKKGPRAVNVVIIEKPRDSQTKDERVICPHCGKRMIPRLITYQGILERSVCPFCGQTYKEFNKCFIATAVYGSPYAPEVIKLRKFRDRYLLQRKAGRFLVGFYYFVSPAIVGVISKSDKMKNVSKKFLDFLVSRLPC